MSEVSRRTFVKAASATVIAGAVLKSVPVLSAAAKQRLHLGIQLYTVRELLAKDLEGTLHQVAAAGYREVESAGYYGRTAPEFKKLVEAAGLRCVSAHHPLAELLPKTDELIQYGHDLGIEYLICSSPAAKDLSRRELTLDEWKWNAEQYNKIGEKAKAAGMQFGYHNHIGELRRVNGVLAYDELLRLTDPALVTMEMDCGWFVVAGFKPADYLTKYPKRFSLLHVKDVVIENKDGGETAHRSTELGRGNIDYAPIFAAAKHVQHYFVEQEEFDMPPLEAIKASADYMKKMKI